MPVVPVLVILYVWIILLVFFSFFTTKIAQMKLRSAGWGILGFLLGPVGLVLVCYLPSRRKDGKETNPIRSGFRSLPGLSQKIFIGLFVLVVLVLGGIYLSQAIPRWQETAKYEKSVGAGVLAELSYAATVDGTPTTVKAGQDSTYLLTEEGELYAWGYNNLSLHQEDKGAAASDVLDVAQLGRDVYLLKKDHTLLKINEEGEETEVATNVAKVTCGADFGSFIKTSGDVYVWGDNSSLQLGAAGEDAEKPRWLCGSATDVSAGARHLLILKKDGAVFGCGSNVSGELGLKDKPTPVTLQQLASGCSAVAAGNEFSLILTKDGVLKSAGADECGQLGRVIEEQEDDKEEKPAMTFQEVATGVDSCGVGGKFGWYIADDALYTWGQNHCGQLGTGDTADLSEPKKILDQVSAAAAGQDHLAALSGGKLYVCGDNSYGQLGALKQKSLTPTTVVTVK